MINLCEVKLNLKNYLATEISANFEIKIVKNYSINYKYLIDLFDLLGLDLDKEEDKNDLSLLYETEK